MAKSVRKPGLLKNGRPPLITQSTSKNSTQNSVKHSSKATRTLIRAHHNLHKSRAKALAEGDQVLVADIDSQIEQLGGLSAYQAASLTGQSKDRGGDSSALLITWLEEEGLVGRSITSQQRTHLRVLEVGALSSQNAISAKVGKGIESVRRIDLKSQEPTLIEEIDFMELPIPPAESEKFDIVSLSLVLNYVPDASGRGEMLKRTRLFLRENTNASTITPCLFFVLPLPCVSNSRYMTADRLQEIMASLGYHSLRVHQSAKLHYELYHLRSPSQMCTQFKKLEVNPGKGRNNFCITLPDG